MRLLAVLALALVAAITLTAPAGPSLVAARDDRTATRPSRILSADLRLRAGHSKTILRVPRVGRWAATCSANADVGVTFTADFLLPTSDVVVSRTAGAPLALRVDPGDDVVPDPPGPVLSQRWQIAPFSAAHVQVTAATVVGRRVGRSECAASVLAIIGPDQGPTRTG